jgi:small conductance mechanosensitive channel
MNNALTRAYEVLSHEMLAWFDLTVKSLPNLVMAILVAICFWMLSSFAHRMSRNLMQKANVNQMLNSLISRTVRTLVLGLGFFLMLGVLDLQKTVTSLLAGAGVIGLVLGLAFQDFMSNFFASILISVRRPFVEGDIIQTNDFMGTVEHVNLRNTVMRNFDGQQILVPNKLVIEKVLQNFSRYGVRRVTITVGVSYTDDLTLAAQTAIQAAQALPGVLKEPAVTAQYSQLAASSVNIDIRFWIHYPKTNFFEIQSQAILAIHRAFGEKGIVIPYPITTLEWRGGMPSSPLPTRP